jgi:hypothetical protein
MPASSCSPTRAVTSSITLDLLRNEDEKGYVLEEILTQAQICLFQLGRVSRITGSSSAIVLTLPVTPQEG